MLFVTASPPSKRALGSTNGLSQTGASIARAIGPATATSLFSFSVEHNILGGNGVYVLLAALSMGGIWLGTYLPEMIWEDPVEDRIEDEGEDA